MPQTEKVVYEAKPGRFVVQELEMSGWEDESSHATLEGARVKANSLAQLFVRGFRVVERNYDD